ncbi:MAG: 5-deoxy-glucuronate isomerase [Actinomycetota bacterium]
MSRRDWHLPAGRTAAGEFAVEIDPALAGWTYSALRVLELRPGDSRSLETGEFETLVLPLSGACRVSSDGAEFDLAGRPDVFAGASDFAYLPRDATAVVQSAGGGRFALPAARCDTRLEPRYGPATAVAVEARGAGQCSRRVANFCMPGTFPADRLLACEVVTPAGNWSSYPPHKHDEERYDRGRRVESVLEEIYYFEVAGGPNAPGMAYHRVYGPGIDVLAEVRQGDVVLVPHGWHGPSMAVPGYDLYYLNVMAGPSPERAWLITDDPDHAWIRDTWRDQDVDPRAQDGGA